MKQVTREVPAADLRPGDLVVAIVPKAHPSTTFPILVVHREKVRNQQRHTKASYIVAGKYVGADGLYRWSRCTVIRLKGN